MDPSRDPPDGFFNGYEFRADGTYIPLFNKQGDPFQDGKGTWALVQTRGAQGRISLKGGTAPPYDNVSFELRNDGVLVIRTSDGPQLIEAAYNRAE